MLLGKGSSLQQLPVGTAGTTWLASATTGGWAAPVTGQESGALVLQLRLDDKFQIRYIDCF